MKIIRNLKVLSGAGPGLSKKNRPWHLTPDLNIMSFKGNDNPSPLEENSRAILVRYRVKGRAKKFTLTQSKLL